MEKNTFIDINGISRTFTVGDKVLYSDGRIGYIESICNCSKCEARGFYEPVVKYMDIDNTLRSDYLTDYSYEHNFSGIYKIGKETFGEKPTEEEINKEIQKCKDKIKEQQDWIKKLNSFKKMIND